MAKEQMSVGDVSSVEPDRSVRVTYPERDNKVSQPLPLAFETTWGGPPKAGQLAIVYGGFCIGIVSEDEPMPENHRGVKFADGSFIYYDMGTGKMNIKASSTVFTGDVQISGDLTFDGNLTINGNLKVNGTIADSGGVFTHG